MEELFPKIIFYGFAVFCVMCAVVVIYGKNLVRSAFALMGSFFSVAVFYAILGADFLAGAQVLIYVGGILTLILFGVMLTNRIFNLNLRTGTFQVIPAALVAGVVFVTLTSIIYQAPWRVLPIAKEIIPTTERIGRLLMTDYLLPFEVASVLLLIALMGAAMLVRRRTDL